ncbi:ABC transporter substrate-binding protein, partial [Pseudomonas aeruginosa]|uniref:ABC transporter substrate-binding protein n=1 Tax=Pseudomonas aeruginosa TaxID=287 RepID=UPI00374A8233
VVQNALPGSTPATSFDPTGFAQMPNGEDFSDYVKQDYTYDPAKAKQLWEEGLKQLGLTKLTLSLEAASDLAPSVATANYLQTNWQTALPGLTVSLKMVPFQQRITDQNDQNFQVMLA